MRRAHLPLFLAIAPLAAALLLPSPRAVSQAPALPPVEGEWRLATRDPERVIDRAIVDVVNEMNFFVRDIAASRIDQALNAERRVAIESGERRVRLAIDRWGPVELPLDGRTQRVRDSRGEPIRARALVRAEHLTLEQITDEGTRVTYFSRGPDENSMTMAVRVRSSQLPRDIVYHLRFTRSR